MPLSFDPNEYVWTWLDKDENIPHDKRPVFKTKPFTIRGENQYFADYSDLIRKENLTRADVVSFLLTRVSDWKHFPEPFSALAIEQYLSSQELWQMVRELPSKCAMGEVESKKFVSQSPISGEASANPAAASAGVTS